MGGREEWREFRGGIEGGSVEVMEDVSFRDGGCFGGSADGDIEGMEEVSRCFGSVEDMKLFYVLVTIVFWLVNFINIVHYARA